MSDKYSVREEVHLPNEILAIIINNLASDAEDNDRTRLALLASCRLASHALSSLATPLLFSSIELTQVAFKERATNLKQILTTNSDIAASVHTLTLRCHKASLENAINGTLISGIIYHLPHIRTFILENEGAWPLEFTAITGDLESAIKSLCRSPNLTTLGLCNIRDFPITVIARCPNLQCLRLSRVEICFKHANPIDEASCLQPCNLDSLEIDDYSIDLLWLRISGPLPGDKPFAKHFSRIKNLRLKNLFYDNASLTCGWDIMLLSSQSLTTIDLSRDNQFGIGFPDVLEVVQFDLGRFPALRHLKVQIRASPRDDNVTILSFLNQLFSISSSACGVETLEIIITWECVESGREKDLFSSDAGWSTLDEALSSEKFVSLQKVVLKLGLEIRPRLGIYYYHSLANLELGRSLTPPYLFSIFRALTSAQH